MKKLLIALVFAILLCGSFVFAEPTLSWNRADGDDGDTVAFAIYWGLKAGVYTESRKVGDVLVYTFPDGDIDKLARYYYAVTGFDVTGNESDYSNEVRSGIKAPVGLRWWRRLLYYIKWRDGGGS